MKKSNDFKKFPIDSFECSKKSIIGLYEMLAQAQPDLIDASKKLSDQGVLDRSTPSRSDE